jgi:hypothetical protein
MHSIPRATALGLGLALAAACTDAAPVPTAADHRLPPGAAARSVADGVEGLQRARIDVSAALDLRTVIPAELVTPAAASGIGPGSAILITIPDDGRYGCTANFVWSQGNRRFLGAAGHCFLPTDRSASHGPGADYDVSGVTVDVCVDGCEGNFRTNQLVGTWVRLGAVAYARQESPAGEAVGHDFGVIEIPRQYRDLVRASLPVWGGPTGVQEMELGGYACHYGHGVGVGEVVLTKARVGVGGISDHEAWAGDFAAAFGDSGSGLVGCVNDGVGSVTGTGAIGVLTHLGFWVDPSTGGHGVVLGTTIARSIEMAREAKLKLALVLP